MNNSFKTILSLCDYSGAWSNPYREAGYKVIQVDLKLGNDIRLFEFIDSQVYGILAAPPCTELGRSLADLHELTAKQAALGRNLLQKYRRQLPADLLAIINGGANQ